MAFISGCPKCQKSVLVPEGHGHDAVVQCPECFAEYSLGEILASIPTLIVVHPGGGAATAEAADVSVAAITPPAESDLSAAPAASGDGTPADQLAEPALDDSDALDFMNEAPAGAAAGDHSDVAFAPEADHAADALFAAAFAEEAPPPSEPGAASDGEGQAPVAGAGDKTDEWGGEWGSFGGEAAPSAVADDTIDLGAHEENGDGGLAHLDFAAITGTSPPATGAATDAAVAVEPPKKKRRKREANPVLRVIGILFFGLLAVPCAFGIAMLFGQKFDLPTWLQWLPFTHTTKQSAALKPSTAAPPSKAETPAGGASTPAAAVTAPGADSGKTGVPDASPGGKPEVPAKPAVPATSPTPPAAGPKAGSADLQPKSKPRTPAADEGATPTEPMPSVGESEERPPLSTAGKGDLTAPAIVAPVTDKPKPEIRNKPEVTDPFATPSAPSATPNTTAKPAAAPKIEPPKSEKPNVEPKPETPPTLQPEPPAKPELPNKPETADPFTIPDISAKPPADHASMVPAPKIERPKAEQPRNEKPKIEQPKIEKPGVESKPELPAPAKPEPLPSFGPPGEPEVPKVEVPKTEPPKAEVPKTDPPKASPVAPAPKPEVKPAPTVGPVGAPTIPSAQLDTALTRVSGAAQPAYNDLCQFAEAATFVQDASAAQKQSLRDAVKKLAGDPQEVSRLAAEAKKLFDSKATKGGIALSGKVSKVASRNGLFGTAVRIEGMTNAVMVFSAHPLDVKEGDTVAVLGALVSDPAKNLPGYSGKQPVVVWADLAAATTTNAK